MVAAIGSYMVACIVGTIVTLIDAAVRQDAAVVATRDYHPVDHVSFMSEGGPFPAPCVQGTKGSHFLPAIPCPHRCTRSAATFGATQTASWWPSRPFQDVDSFGAFPYASGGDGRWQALAGRRRFGPSRGWWLRLLHGAVDGVHG